MAVVKNRYMLRYTIAVVVVWVIIILVRLPTAVGVPRPRAVANRPATPTFDSEIVEPPIVLRGRKPVHGVVPNPTAHEPSATPPPSNEGEQPEQGSEQSPTPPSGGMQRDRWTTVPRRSFPDDQRRDVVVKAIKDSWEGYKKYAWGWDEFAPISRRTSNWGQGSGIGATIIDALDTLLIAGLDKEADEAIEWAEQTLTFDQPIKLSMFETTIRVLGGLLSAYQITGRPKLLDQASSLGTRLSRGFDTPSGLPDNYVNLKTGHHEGAAWNGGAAILSELGSLQMEYYTLSVADPKTAGMFNKARKAIEKVEPSCGDGYCPRMFSGGFGNGAHAGLGSFGDSFYEYLLKQWLLSGRKDELYLRMWTKAAAHTISTSTTVGGRFVPNGRETGNTVEHLACFSGGLFALSYIHTENAEHLDFAKKVGDTCHAMYQTETGLAPDVAVVDGNGEFRSTDAKYILRPETVETYFYLWRATHDPKYRDWGFEVMKAINKHLKIDGAGYAGAINVHAVPARHNDNMETFWFAETLKYLYLLFSEDEKIDLHRWVFNTEAHPFRIQQPKPAETESPQDDKSDSK
jgi:hypothetical protein